MDGDLPYRPPVIPGPEVLDVALQCRPVDMAARDPEFVERIDVAVGILAHHGQQRPYQLLLDAVPSRADHAEVDDRDPLARLDEEVAGMRVGMKEPVPEHHLEHHSGAVPGNFPSIEPGGFDGSQIVDLDAGNALQGQ